MGNFAENLNLGNRFRPPPPIEGARCKMAPTLFETDTFT